MIRVAGSPRRARGRRCSAAKESWGCPPGLRRAPVLAAMLLASAGPLPAEEVLFQDGRRLMAMVEAAEPTGQVTLRLPNGRTQAVTLGEIAAVTFRGRAPRAIRAGTQEFHAVAGGRLKAEVVRLAPADTLEVRSPATGPIALPLAAIEGFVTMPVEGRAGRRALELVTGDDEDATGFLDQVLDRRAAGYAGVIEKIDEEQLRIDHERMRQTVSLNLLYLAGVRLARETRALRPTIPPSPWRWRRSRGWKS